MHTIPRGHDWLLFFLARVGMEHAHMRCLVSLFFFFSLSSSVEFSLLNLKKKRGEGGLGRLLGLVIFKYFFRNERYIRTYYWIFR